MTYLQEKSSADSYRAAAFCKLRQKIKGKPLQSCFTSAFSGVDFDGDFQCRTGAGVG